MGLDVGNRFRENAPTEASQIKIGTCYHLSALYKEGK
jgi:hypothetical protein